MNNAPSKRQCALVVKKLNRRGIVMQLGASYETLCMGIVTVTSCTHPKTLMGKCSLILDYLYDRMGMKSLPPMQPLKLQKGMAEALKRCEEYRQPGYTDRMK